MSFSDIYGHARQIGLLQKSIAQQRVAHAYIFSGPDAIGKKTLALAFAKVLNCESNALKNDACGNCSSCRKMISGSHPDLHRVETQAQFLRIDTIRNIQDQMTFKPLEGRKRIFIIDEADKMNEQAANALLKTLEEPSADNILILVTARPYWLPQTILSRCRHVRFNPLSNDTVSQFLVLQMQMDTARAAVVSSLSGGSIGQALELDSEDAIAFRAELGRLLAEADQSNPQGLLALASFLGQDKKEIRQGLSLLKSYFRDTLIYKETAGAVQITNADDFKVVSSLAERLQSREILQNIALVEKAHETIQMNVNKSLTLEAMAFKLRL